MLHTVGPKSKMIFTTSLFPFIFLTAAKKSQVEGLNFGKGQAITPIFRKF